MKTGIDIVEIERIKKIISESSTFVNNILYQEEMKPWNLESICGKIAAKEAIIKTGFISIGEWKNIKILLTTAGAPQIFDKNNKLISKLHISISHTASLAIAMAIYE